MADLRNIRSGQYGFHRQASAMQATGQPTDYIYEPGFGLEDLARAAYEPTADITPVVGDLRAAQRGGEYAAQAYEAAKQGDVLSALGYGGGSLGEYASTVPGLGEAMGLAGMAGKGLAALGGTIIGPSAKFFHKTMAEAVAAGRTPNQSQEIAEQMLADGAPMRMVTAETGYYRDSAGNWKSQIDDTGAKHTPVVPQVFKNWKPSQKLNEGGRWPKRQLSKVFDHKVLYENYPWLATDKVKVEFSTRTNFGAAEVHIDDKTGRATGGTIYINPQGVKKWKDMFGLESMDEAFRSMMVHEVNHVVQGIDNLPSGSSREWWDQIRAMEPQTRKELAALEETISKLPAGVPRRVELEEQAAHLRTHLNFLEANRDSSSDDLYINTLGEMDAFWAQTMRDTENVRFRLPISEDRGKMMSDEGIRQPSVLPHRVAVTSPGTGVIGTRMDTRPSEMMPSGPAGTRGTAKSMDFSVASDMSTYHASPHDFDAFDLRYAGTGEGASAYGHGVYLSETEKVQDFYHDQFQRGLDAEKGRLENRISALKQYMKQPRLSQAEWQDYRSQIQEAQDQLDRRDWDAKRYSVEIPDEAVAKMMDWDAPLDKQPKAVQDMAMKIRNVYGPSQKGQTGGEFYKNLKVALGGEKKASEWLKKNGVPGLRYYDGDSRQATYGTRNFVVFDDTIPQITYKGKKKDQK